ncbi:MAG: hypothetical protein ACFFBH_06635 [Promethearchaeota archaeon]
MPNLIIVDITETEQTKLDSNGNLKEINGYGTLTIKNPSNKSKLWDLNCDLKEIVNTTMDSREIALDSLNPSQETSKSYQIKNLKKPSLVVTELFNLSNQYNKYSIKIKVTNAIDHLISNIKISRELPDKFKNIEYETPEMGKMKINTVDGVSMLEWDILELIARNSTEVLVKFNMDEVKIKNSIGSLNVSYDVNKYQLSRLKPEILSNTNISTKIHKQSQTEEIWDCRIEFLNASEFQVKLENVKVINKESTGSKVIISQAPNKVLNPLQSWIHNFQIKSLKNPKLNSIIEYFPLFVVINHVIGDIEKESNV